MLAHLIEKIFKKEAYSEEIVSSGSKEKSGLMFALQALE